MATCFICGTSSHLITKALNVCLACIRNKPAQASAYIEEAHAASRKPFGLPSKPPRDLNGAHCTLCVNECRVPEGGISYCGLRTAVNKKLTGLSRDEGKLLWYHDPLPTNCVADWVCPGGMWSGVPEICLFGRA